MNLDLTTGKLSKQILLFSLPLMLSNLLQVLFNMSDIAVVGRFAGAQALGAVGSTTTLVTLFTGFLIGMGNGVNVLIARYYGAKDEQSLEKAVHTAAIISFALGILILAFGQALTKFCLELLGTKRELIAGAELYLRIYFLGMPAMAVYNYGNAVFSATGDTKSPLLYLLCAGIINVILNLFFVIVLKMDVAGVATASVISQYISAALIIAALLRSSESYKLRLGKMRVDKKQASMVISLGIPSGVQYSIFAIANLFIQSAVNTFDASVVAGNSAAANYDALTYDMLAAFYTACSSFIGQNYGAGNRSRIKKSYFISLAYSFGIGAVIGIVLLVFGRQLLSLFTSTPAVKDAGMIRLQVMACSYAFSVFMDNTIAASRGLGKTLVPTVIVVLGSCVFRVVWIYTVFARFRTMQSLYLLYIFSWCITAVAEIAYFARVYRSQTKLRQQIIQ